MKLSENFWLYEFEKSQTAKRKGIDNRIKDPELIDNITAVVLMILQPLRTETDKPMNINSGYRSPALNSAVGGSKSSQHLRCEAADIEIFGMSNPELAEKIIKMKLPFDQLILEFHDPEDGPNDGWVHVSHKRGGPQRGQILTINSRGTHSGLVY